MLLFSKTYFVRISIIKEQLDTWPVLVATNRADKSVRVNQPYNDVTSQRQVIGDRLALLQ